MYRLMILAFMCCCAGAAMGAAQGVTAVLRSCRTEYRTHNNAMNPGLSCTLELIAPPGTQMCESASLTGIIRVKDATGNTVLADRRGVEIGNDNRALTTFTLRQRPTGEKIELQGELLVTVATERTAHEPAAVSLIESSELKLSKSITVKVTPDRMNAAENNREGTKICRAVLTLACPRGVTIRRVERVWYGIHQEVYTQPIELNTIGRSSYQIELWDANPTEFLRIVTVRNPRRENVNFRLQVTLGNVSSK